MADPLISLATQRVLPTGIRSGPTTAYAFCPRRPPSGWMPLARGCRRSSTPDQIR